MAILTISLTSCAGIAPTGGPCDYTDIPVEFEVIKTYPEKNGFEIKATAIEGNDQNKLDRSYTNDVQHVKSKTKLPLEVGNKFKTKMQIMTKGSCNPRPMAIEYQGNYLEIVNKEELEPTLE